MSAPIHKRCYRCNRPVRDLVDPADLIGGEHGACDDCRLTLAATEVAREWRIEHGDDPTAPHGISPAHDEADKP